MLDIKVCSFNDIEKASNVADLVKEATEEAAVDGLEGNLHFPTYRMLDQSGMLKTIKAELDGLLVGYATVLLHTSLHFSVVLAQLETIYVLQEYRPLGVGAKLIKQAEIIAEAAKVPYLFANPRIGSAFEKVLEGRDYKPTHTIRCKRFDYGTTADAA